MIPISKPWLGDEDANAVKDTILSGWIAQGQEVLHFEREFAEFVEAKHACAVSSGTAALHIALLALGVEAGDEIITVSHSFISTANCIRFVGATPVFVDIERTTCNIDVGRVEEAFTKRTRAILPVHQMGLPCDIERIVVLAKKYNVPVVEDAACALGSEIRIGAQWEKIGRPHGDICCFSFHPRKILTTGEGGMIVTRDGDVERRVRRLRNQGRESGDGGTRYREVGYNYRMSDIHASLGRVQLIRLEEIVTRRRFLAGLYSKYLSGIQGIEIPMESKSQRTNWQSYCIRLPDGFRQQEIIDEMERLGVRTMTGIMCAHREDAYKRYPWSYRRSAGGLEESENAQDKCLILPMFHELAERDIEYIARSLKKCLSQ